MAWNHVEIEVETIIDTDLGLYIKRIDECLAARDYDGALRECETFKKMGGGNEVYEGYVRRISLLKAGKNTPNTVIENKLRKIICDALAMKSEQVNGMMTMADLGADSLDVFEVVMGIEEEFGVEIPFDTAKKYSRCTISELAQLLSQYR